MNNLAVVYHDQKKFVDAEVVLREVLDIYRKAVPADDRQLAAGLFNLGVILLDEQRSAEAERRLTTMAVRLLDADRIGPIGVYLQQNVDGNEVIIWGKYELN